MAPLRRHIGASRRKRREEDGEEEGSMAGDMGDDSLSEGSADSHQEDEDADGEVSEESEDEVSALDKAGKVNGRGVDKSTRSSSASPEKRGLKTTVSDTEAMLNGLKISDGAGDAAEVHFDNLKEQQDAHLGRTPSAPPTEPNRNNLASRKRRENDKYVKEREHLWRTMYLIKLEVRHYLLAYWDDLEDNIDFCAADRLPQIYYALNRLNVETGAFSQLTRKYMTETFNPNTPDVDDVRYVPDILPTLRPANIPQIFLLWSSSRAKYMVCLSAFTPSTCRD